MELNEVGYRLVDSVRRKSTDSMYDTVKKYRELGYMVDVSTEFEESHTMLSGRYKPRYVLLIWKDEGTAND